MECEEDNWEAIQTRYCGLSSLAKILDGHICDSGKKYYILTKGK